MPVAPDPFFTALDISWPATGPFSRSFPRNSLVHCDHCVLNWLCFTTLCFSVALNVKSLAVSFLWLLIMVCYLLFRSYVFWNKNWIRWRPNRLNPNLMWWVLIAHLSSCFSPYHLYLCNLAPIKSTFYLSDLTYFLCEGNTSLVLSQILLVCSLFCRKNFKSCRKDWLFWVVNFGKPKLVNEPTKWQRRSWYALPR